MKKIKTTKKQCDPFEIKNIEAKNHLFMVVLAACLILLYFALQFLQLTPTGNVVMKTMCYDSDGTDLVNPASQDSYYTKGVVMQCGEFCKDFNSDKCIGNSKNLNDKFSYDILQEFYCDGNEIKAIAYTCPNGCNDGVCVE